MKSLFVAALLALAAPLQAQQSLTASFSDFSGGLNNAQDASEIAPNESPDLLNVIIDDPGGVRPRKGLQKCGDTPSGDAATMLFAYTQSDGTEKLIVSDNDNVWETKDCVNFTTITDELVATERPDFEVVRDDLWIVQQSTHVQVWDGTTRTPLDARSGTPNPAPCQGEFIEYWKGRVFIANTASDPSAICFNAVTDPTGVYDLDPSTGSEAWPATNVFYVDRDGGCPIYGIEPYRDRLYVFKGECGIWRIDFRSDSDNSIVKTLASVGTRFDTSIVEHENMLFFVGPDGVYAFNGDTVQLVSDKVNGTFETLAQPRVSNQLKIWTDNEDFLGTDHQTATNTVAGAAVVGSTLAVNSAFDLADQTISVGDSFNSGGNVWTVEDDVSGNHDWVFSSGRLKVDSNNGTHFLSTRHDEPDFSGQTGRSYEFTYQFGANTSVGGRCYVHLMAASTTTQNTNGYLVRVPADGGSADLTLRRNDGTATSATSLISGGSLSAGTDYDLKVHISSGGHMELFVDGTSKGTATDTNYTNSEGLSIYCDNQAVGDDNRFSDFKETVYYQASTFTFTAYNAVDVSSWTTIAIAASANGTDPRYDVRCATTEAGLTGSWSTVSNGDWIPCDADEIWFQFRAFTQSDEIAGLELQSVTANWAQGGLPGQNIYATRFGNRYLFNAASGTATTNNLTLVRSRTNRPPGWTLFNWQAGPMAVYSDDLYVAASTSSVIYQALTSDTDDGAAIEWYWQSRDETYKLPFNRKRLLEILPQYRRNDAANATVGYSVDAGTSWTDYTVDMSGTGYGSKRLHTNDWGLTIRFRIRSTTAGEEATLLNLNGIAKPQRFRQ